MIATTIFGVASVALMLCYRLAKQSKVFKFIVATLSTIAVVSAAFVALGITREHSTAKQADSATRSTIQDNSALNAAVAKPVAPQANQKPGQISKQQTNNNAQTINAPVAFGDHSTSIGSMSGNSQIINGSVTEQKTAK